jgi:hypothetical protein
MTAWFQASCPAARKQVPVEVTAGAPDPKFVDRIRHKLQLQIFHYVVFLARDQFHGPSFDTVCEKSAKIARFVHDLQLSRYIEMSKRTNIGAASNGAAIKETTAGAAASEVASSPGMSLSILALRRLDTTQSFI